MTTRSRPSFALVLTALLLLAVNLRLAVTSASALLTLLVGDGALTPLTAMLVPALPTAMFALAGLFTPWLAARIGAGTAVSWGVSALAAGMLLRIVPSPLAVVAGTVIATAGLAVVNILLPALVRATAGARVGAVTTAYTTIMSLGAATAAAAAVPVAHALGSASLGLGAWALPALLAVVVWTVVSRRAGVDAAIPAPPKAERGPLPAGTWALTAFFALQALSSYVIMGWLPTIAIDAGIAETRAGVLLGLAMALGIPATVVIVALARTAARLRVGVLIVGLASAAGMIGLWIAPAAAPELWAVLLGIGMCAFPLVFALIARIGDGPSDSARVSAVAQGVGYAVATVGPLGAGAWHGAGGSWSFVLALLLVGAIAQCVIGLVLARTSHASSADEEAAEDAAVEAELPGEAPRPVSTP